MSVSLSPSNSLGFNRPLTELVKRSLTITNHNAQAVTFKVKTTAPKLYCVRPNSGKVEPGESVDVLVMLQPMKEEPSLAAKCKDKFLIQSTLITPEKEGLSLADMWNSSDSEETKVHQQKLKVVYLPPIGQTLQEEDESAPHTSSLLPSDSQFATVRQHLGTNGRTLEPIPGFDDHDQSNDLSHSRELGRPASPPGDFSPAREDDERSHHEATISVTPPPVMVVPSLPNHNVPAPAPTPAPVFVPTPAPAPVIRQPSPEPYRAPVVAAAVVKPEQPRQPRVDYETKFVDAQAEITRLQGLLATASAPVPELRRRSKTLVDDDGDSTIAGTEYGGGGVEIFQAEGVPLQVVVIIAFSVFCVTYLFF